MSAMLYKSRCGDTGYENWFIRTDKDYETFIMWGPQGPDGPARALATRAPEREWVWHKSVEAVPA